MDFRSSVPETRAEGEVFVSYWGRTGEMRLGEPACRAAPPAAPGPARRGWAGSQRTPPLALWMRMVVWHRVGVSLDLG